MAGSNDGHAAAAPVAAMLAAVSAAMQREKDHLSDLDGVIGDGDHGTTMALGFRAVDAALSRRRPGGEAAAPAELLRAAATAFLDAVGASTGPLYATGLRRAAQRLDGHAAFGAPEQVLMIEGIAAGIAECGRARRGDKTMLDVWLPAAEAARAALESGTPIWPPVLAVAAERARATASLVAARGRSARLGERSIGHADPGAVSAEIILRAMAQAVSPDPAAG